MLYDSVTCKITKVQNVVETFDILCCRRIIKMNLSDMVING